MNWSHALLVLVLSIIGINAQPHLRTCPRCTDPYNHASCTQVQTCHEAAVLVAAHTCELRVHTADRNRVDYACAVTRTCNTLESRNCNNNQHVCYHCCENVESCLSELRQLFAERYTTHGPATTTTTRHTTAAHTTSLPVTTTGITVNATSSEVTNTSYTGTDTTAISNAGSTSISSTQTTSSNSPEATTESSVASQSGVTTAPSTTPSFNSTTQRPNSCVQCGDFANDEPCTAKDLLLNDADECPEGLPYCFETIKVSGGNIEVSRGCAEDNFCRVVWDLSHGKTGCYPFDPSTDNLSCTYCCAGDSCNALTPPSEDLLVTFP